MTQRGVAAHTAGEAAAARRVRTARADQCCASVLTAPLSGDEAHEIAAGFSALGDPVRLQILSMLAAAPDGEICVCEFIEPLGRTQGTISHHLKILGEAGLVHGDRRGKWVWYSLDRDRLRDLRSVFDEA